MAKLSFLDRMKHFFGANWLDLDLKGFHWEVTRGQKVQGAIVLKSEKLKLPIKGVKIIGKGFRYYEVETTPVYDDEYDDMTYSGGKETQSDVIWEMQLNPNPIKPEIEAGETMEIPFEFDMPADLPPTSNDVKYEMEFEVQTKGLNPFWYDDLTVK